MFVALILALARDSRRFIVSSDTRKAREKYEQIMLKQKETRAKRGQPTSESERHNSGGLKGIAQALRRNGPKKT